MPKAKPTKLHKHCRLSSPRSIRVLTLSPSPEFAAPLELSLTETSLDRIGGQSIRYEALSYVWGSRTGDRPLLCNGKTLLVTHNCESALRHLRLPEETRTLWVDAICIDQDAGKESVLERNVQVGMMGEVYHQATRTICWLGEGTGFTKEVIARLEKVGSCPSRRELKKVLQFDERCRKAGLLDEASSSLDHIFCHPWHSRVWTVQEVAHSADCQIMCGQATISWSLYSAAAEFLIYKEFIDELDIQTAKTYASIDMRNTLRKYILGPESSLPSGKGAEYISKMSFLFSCLTEVRHLQATDSRDRVYGLHASFSVLGIPLPAPDYGKSCARVYEESALSMIIYSRSLEVLRFASSNNRKKELPSWVPDWEDDDVRLVTPSSDATKGSLVADIELSMLAPVPGQLHVRGKIVGSVAIRTENDFRTLDFAPGIGLGQLPILNGETYEFTQEIDALRMLIHQVRLFREWKTLVETATCGQDEGETADLFYDLLNFETDRSAHDVFDIWVDTLNYPNTTQDLSSGEQLAAKWKAADACNAVNWSPDITHCAIIAAYLINCSMVETEDSDSKAATKLMELAADLASNMGDRTLIVLRYHETESTILGTAFCETESGDVLVLLEGAEFPVVLRQHVGLWQFIGPAFVIDIMNGDEWSGEEGNVGQLTNFILV